MPKNKTNQRAHKEEEIIVHCPECGKLLWSDRLFVYCTTPGCRFRADDLLEFWIFKHAENSDV